MADSSEGDELPRCSTLFLTEDGSQMLFYMTPCAMKTRLRPLIYVGLLKKRFKLKHYTDVNVYTIDHRSFVLFDFVLL